MHAILDCIRERLVCSPALSRVILKQFLNDIVLFPDHDGWDLLWCTTVRVVAVPMVVLIWLDVFLFEVEDFVDSQLDSSHFTVCDSIFAHARVVIQDELELIAKELLGRSTSEATALEEESQSAVLHQLAVLGLLLIIVLLHLG